MKEKLIKLLVENVDQVFQMMLSSTPVPGNPAEGDSSTKNISGITAIVGFAGDPGSCVLYLFCSFEISLVLASRMLFMEMEKVDEDVKDAMGEIANMVAGSLKSSLSDMGLQFDLSIPTIISGKGYEIDIGQEKLHSISIPFEFDGGDFRIMLTITDDMLKNLEGVKN